MKFTRDTLGDEWQCDGERYRFYMGHAGFEFSNWHDGDYNAAETYMADMGCKPVVIEWSER